MAKDMNLRDIEVGDWVKMPDNVHPFSLEDGRYGSRCRHAIVTRLWDDGVIATQFQQMYDFRNLTDQPFLLAVDIHANEVMVVKDSEGFVNYNESEGPSAPVGHHVRGEQPRDERGRFTSHNTTVRPW